MEEKNTQKQEKLSYDELKARFDELYTQYRKLVAEYQKAMGALSNFDHTSYLLQILFKVMENPAMYTDEFVKWCAENIQDAVTGFVESAKEQAEEEAKKEKKNED